MRWAWRFTWLAVAVVLLGACSDDEEPQSESGAQRSDHVWKEQTRAVDKARAVGRTLEEAAARQRKATE